MSIYSDINQYDTTEQDILIDIDAIYQSIDNILLTSKNQRLFLPEFGTDMINFLFDPMDRPTLFAMKSEIINAINQWEPRIVLHRQKSSIFGKPQNHTVELNLVFIIKGLNSQEYVYSREISKNSLGQYYAV